MTTHLADERVLVIAARSGDTEAFGLLVSHYYRKIYHLALKITRNHQDAEDVLQEASLKAYCNIRQFQGNSRFYTWLVRIAVNEALMKLRKRRSDRLISLGEAVASDNGFVLRQFEDWTKHPEKFYFELELAETFRRALASLSPRLAEALVLRSAEELSMNEAAAVLRLSSSALKSRLVRARSLMRKRLRAMCPAGPWGKAVNSGIHAVTSRGSTPSRRRREPSLMRATA